QHRGDVAAHFVEQQGVPLGFGHRAQPALQRSPHHRDSLTTTIAPPLGAGTTIRAIATPHRPTPNYSDDTRYTEKPLPTPRGGCSTRFVERPPRLRRTRALQDVPPPAATRGNSPRYAASHSSSTRFRLSKA